MAPINIDFIDFEETLNTVKTWVLLNVVKHNRIGSRGKKRSEG